MGVMDYYGLYLVEMDRIAVENCGGDRHVNVTENDKNQTNFRPAFGW